MEKNKRAVVSVYRKSHFNAAHRLHNPAWDDQKNKDVFGVCNNPNYHGHNYDLVVKVTGETDADFQQTMHLAEDVYVEIIDPNTEKSVESGETGEVVVTNFNKTYPLIRLGTGDLSYLDAEPCPCGRTSPRLVKIVGRVGDSFKVRGLFVHDSQVREAMTAATDELVWRGEMTGPRELWLPGVLTAWMSPVRCRLNCSIGMTCE